MNHWDFSPVGNVNEVARKKGTPTQEVEGGSSSTNYKNDDKYKYLVGTEERLEKLRRSSHHRHSSHHPRSNHARRVDAMDDDEHNAIIKGLLYPGLEEEADEGDCDFFEEDYELAQAAVASAPPPSSVNHDGGSIMPFNTSNTDPNRTNPFATTSALLSRIEREMQRSSSSYERSYFASMGRPYSDMTSEKLGRR